MIKIFFHGHLYIVSSSIPINFPSPLPPSFYLFLSFNLIFLPSSFSFPFSYYSLCSFSCLRLLPSCFHTHSIFPSFHFSFLFLPFLRHFLLPFFRLLFSFLILCSCFLFQVIFSSLFLLSCSVSSSSSFFPLFLHSLFSSPFPSLFCLSFIMPLFSSLSFTPFTFMCVFFSRSLSSFLPYFRHSVQSISFLLPFPSFSLLSLPFPPNFSFLPSLLSSFIAPRFFSSFFTLLHHLSLSTFIRFSFSYFFLHLPPFPAYFLNLCVSFFHISFIPALLPPSFLPPSSSFTLPLLLPRHPFLH